ncbi:MAG: hypothetical protein ISS53_02210 [Dehalococcoidia bacterium]|nr:hypothetical protein [Dehalococcoidia bacterium]
MSVLEPTSIALLLITGLAVGFAQGLLGVGGSLVMVPVTWIIVLVILKLYLGLRMIGVFD